MIGSPGEGRRAVGLVVREKLELAAAFAAPADVLHDHQVTVRGVPGRVSENHGRGDPAAIGLAHQQSRKAAWRIGPIDVGDERHAILQAQIGAFRTDDRMDLGHVSHCCRASFA